MKKTQRQKKPQPPQDLAIVQPSQWRVEYPQKVMRDSSITIEWMAVLSPIGEKLVFQTQAKAETQARQLSLLNPQVYRVIVDDDAKTFVVYDYGVLYTENAETGERTRMDTAMFDADPDESVDLYTLQVRKPHGQNNGRFVSWQRYIERDYVALEDAEAEAATLSKDQPTKEFRVVVAWTDLAPKPVVFRGGHSLPDVEVLANLCHVLTPLDDVSALILLLTEWKGMAQAHSLIQALYKKVLS